MSSRKVRVADLCVGEPPAVLSEWLEGVVGEVLDQVVDELVPAISIEDDGAEPAIYVLFPDWVYVDDETTGAVETDVEHRVALSRAISEAVEGVDWSYDDPVGALERFATLLRSGADAADARARALRRSDSSG